MPPEPRLRFRVDRREILVCLIPCEDGVLFQNILGLKCLPGLLPQTHGIAILLCRQFGGVMSI